MKISKIILLFFIANFAFAETTVNLNSTNIQQNDLLTLEIKTNSIIHNEPDFSKLEKDFEIISNSKQFYQANINGKSSQDTIWEITLSPKKMGNLVIPSFIINKDKTNTINIKVSKEIDQKISEAKDIFLQTSLEKNKIYVNQANLLTIKIYIAADVKVNQLDFHNNDNNDFQLIHLSDTNSKTTVNNRSYILITRRYALFPKKTGTIDVSGFVLTGGIADLKNSRTRNADPFFNFISYKPINISAPGKNLKVKAKPVNFAGPYWLPAQNLTMVQKIDYDENLKQGDVITRKITIKATGLPANFLPEPNEIMPKNNNFKIYPDKAKFDNTVVNGELIGQVEQTISLIPNKAGNFTLPEVTLAWWSNKHNIVKNSSLPEENMIINNLEKNDYNISKDNKIINDKTQSSSEKTKLKSALNKIEYQNNNYLYLIIISALAILCGILGLKLFKNKKNNFNQENPNLFKKKLNELKQACNQNNYKLAYSHLITLENYAGEYNEASEIIAVIKKYIKDLECIIYSQEENINWNGAKFYKNFNNDLKYAPDDAVGSGPLEKL